MSGSALLLLFAAAVGDESLGVNAHNGAPEFIAAASALGVKWVRLDGNWDSEEPQDEAYNWYLDDAVNNANAAGINVFISLGYTPDWVSRHGDTDGLAMNDPPNDSVAWSDFVTDAVTHYRALGVRHFGMWNEANLTQFWEGSSDEFVDLIAVPGAAAVRAACMDCVVLGPELAFVGPADNVLEAIMMRAPIGTFDIVTQHSYNQFTETGWHVWDGDSYINMLDMQRFPFTRRSIRQVLDLVGWAGEVWITETGYRANPGDMAEEDLQAVYVRRVMEEQLLRAWYTNTFFYEINDCGVDQPGCPIDGFGLIRPTAGTPGSRNFPADFRLKPAFDEIQMFIANNPSIVGTQPPKQCGDGLDNDHDGRVDLADRGCGGAQDDDESDDPPRMRIDVAPLATAAVIDGSLSELTPADLLPLDLAGWRGTEPLDGAGDLSASVAVRWEADALYFAFDVTDDLQDNTHVAAELWQGDSVQIAFDPAQSGGSGYDNVDDQELGFALLDSGAAFSRFHGPAAVTAPASVGVQRSGTHTTYEMRVPAAALPGVAFRPGTVIGFSFLINEADGAGRIGWIEWTPGIGTTKEPELFGELALVDGTPAPDAGVADAGIIADAGEALDAAANADAASNADAAALSDAGVALDDSGMSHPAPADASDAPVAAEGGCGCTSAQGESAAPAALTALLLLLLLLPLCARRRP